MVGRGTIPTGIDMHCITATDMSITTSISAHVIGEAGEDHMGVVVVDSKSWGLLVHVVAILQAGSQILAEMM